MIFAILFFIAFVVGVIAYLVSNRWWAGGVIMVLLLLVFSITGLEQAPLRGMAVYFGIPIIFLGSLFGAYIVQLRRAPELGDTANSADAEGRSQDGSEPHTQIRTENNDEQ